MRKVFMFVCAVIAVACIFLAQSFSQQKIQIAVLGKVVHPYWTEVEAGVKAAGKKYNIKTTFFVPLKEDVNTQISTLEGYIAKKVSGIAFAPSDPDAAVSVVKDALRKKIPCVTLDSDAPKTGRYVFIGTNTVESGKTAGEQMAKLLGGKGKVAIATGSLTARNSLEKIDGFKAALKKYPGIKIVTTVVDGEDAAKAFSNAEQVLLKYKDLNGFFGVYGINGPAIGLAVKRAKRSGKVKVVCFDTTPDIVKLLKEGAIQVTLAQSPYAMGYKSVEILYQMITQGVAKTLKSVPKNRFIDTGVDVVTKANLEDYKKKLKKLGIPVKF